MSAELLREAAALMRERAEAFTMNLSKCVDPKTCGADGFCGAPQLADMWPENAEHIASWHPAVALAVADWLEAEATALKSLEAFGSMSAALVREQSWTLRGAAISVGQKEDGSITMQADTSSSALTVARAYLGRDA